MICRHCDTRNPANSRFCNNCGASLRPTTSLICPNCGASNPNHLLYCDQCGTRLPGPEIIDEQPQGPEESSGAAPTPFTLPSRPAGKTANLNISDGIPDWLRTGEKPGDTGTEPPDQHETAGDLPTWLLGEELEESFFGDRRTTDELFGTAGKPEGESAEPAGQELPEWLRGLAPEGTGPLPVSESQWGGDEDQRSLDDWLARLEEPAATDEPSDWQPSLEEPATSTGSEVDWPPELQGDEDDASDWLAALTIADDAGEPADEAEDDGGLTSSMEPDSWMEPLEQQPAEPPGATAPEAQPPDPESDDVPRDEFEMEGVPDWLLGVAPESPPDAEPVADDAIPDWLSGLEEEEAPAGAFAEPELPEDQGLPNWLAGLEPAPEEDWLPSAVEPAAEPADELPDWLEEIGAPAGAETSLPAGEDAAEPEEADWLLDFDFSAELDEDATTPDWLQGLEEDEPGETISEAAFPDWLEPSAGPPAEEAGEAAATLGDPGWPAPEETPAAEQGPGAAGEYDWLPEGEETPDWLLAVTPDDEERDPDRKEEVPDWLSELDAAIGELEAASQESPDDWPDLQGDASAGSREAVEDAWALAERAAVEAGQDEEAPEKELLPAWLAPTELSAQADRLDFEEEEPAGAGEETAAQPAAGQDDADEALPDWLRELDEVSRPGTAPLDDAKLPEWLRQGPETEDAAAEEWLAGEPVAEEAGEAPAAALPDSAAHSALDDSEAGEAELEMDEILGEWEGGDVIPASELPDWLDDVVVSEEFPTDFAPADLDTVPEILASRELPGWLEDSLPDEEIAEPTPAEEIPSWLRRPAVAEPEPPALELEAGAAGEWTAMLSELSSAEEEAEEISAADIPEWLQELQPGRPGSSRRAEAETVTEGPLAGLSGVLGVEPIVAVTRASEFPGRFEASKEQQEQAALLRQLTRTEPHEGERVVARPKATSSPWLRLILSLLLLAAVVTGLVLPGLIDVGPAPIYPVAPVSEVLGAAAGQPVLVVFDYTPALGGIMNRQAELLLQSLAAQGSPVLYASQSAAGLGLAATSVAAITDLQASRLGYIPGETVGLRRLAACLGASGASAAACDGYPAETAAVAAIVLLTGDRDSLVDWIEQVDAVAGVPLVAGVTRALLPVAAPYYSSGQIDALLAGEPAAAAYAAATGAAGSASQTAAALATWLVVALLLVGNIFFAISGVARSRRA
jgi:hypothetical protein